MRKVCSICGIEKELTDFEKRKDSEDGYRNQCKQCLNKLRKQRKDKIREVNNKKPEPSNIILRKVCSKCGVEKDITEFEKDKSIKSGYRSWCKQCANNFKREYHKIFDKSPVGKVNIMNKNSKKRKLGFSPINEYFQGAVSHHFLFDEKDTNKDLVIFIPENLHETTHHDSITGKGILEINIAVLEWYFKNTPADNQNSKAKSLYWYYCNKPEGFEKSIDELEKIKQSNPIKIFKCFKKGDLLSFREISEQTGLIGRQLTQTLWDLKISNRLKYDKDKKLYFLP